MNNKLVIILVSVIVILLVFQITNSLRYRSFEQRREKILSEIALSIKEARQKGNYNCCIEPACKMCFLGHWIWNDGSCDCDGMILKGEMDKVCPECRKGLEKGECSSTNETCEV